MKLNNGYMAVIHYLNGERRYFGPYPTTLEAFNELRTTWNLGVIIPPVEADKARVAGRGFRPVISRKYQVEQSAVSIVALSVEVLEVNHNKD